MTSRLLAERILRHIQSRGYVPQRADDLAGTMGIAAKGLGAFRSACRELVQSGRLALGRGNKLTLPNAPSRISGVFRLHANGYGFVIPDEANAHGDLFVPKGKTRGAMTGDTVVARAVKRGKRAGVMVYEGWVVEIRSRGQSRFVGELTRMRGRWIVMPDGGAIPVPIVVGDPGAKGAQAGDQVVGEITEYPSQGSGLRGVIISVLGVRGEPDVEVHSTIARFELPVEFGEAVQADARSVVAKFNARAAGRDREDLRERTVITIDPSDARDFDDAFSIRRLRDDRTELGVHIADVAYFVKPDGPMDAAARDRSNSVYLPRCVIPMLPETLSNGLCSLQQDRTRLTKSVFVIYDCNARVVNVRIVRSIIRSKKRLTYEGAQRILDGTPGRTNVSIVRLLKSARLLAQNIRRRRIGDGMLELDLPETELVFDDDGRAVDVRARDTGFTHKIIEMFMVEANEAVARFLVGEDVPLLRRIHDGPSPAGTKALERTLSLLGLKVGRGTDRRDLQFVLDSVRGEASAASVHFAVLRSMRRAEYSPLPIGHYALASTDYCHFTSPIRRYPDLTVHRLIDEVLNGSHRERHESDQNERERELISVGRQCSENERRAESAERDLKLTLTLRLLERYVGRTYPGRITGMSSAGLFVQLGHYGVDGLLPFTRLGNEWWGVDRYGIVATGERSGTRLAVGDHIDVVIQDVRIASRQLELGITADGISASSGRGGKREMQDCSSGGRRRRRKGDIRRESSRMPRRKTIRRRKRF